MNDYRLKISMVKEDYQSAHMPLMCTEQYSDVLKCALGSRGITELL